MQTVKRKYGVKDILDALPELRVWIEQTKLFNAIKELTNTQIINGKPVVSMFDGIPVTLVSESINMNLVRNVSIKTPYDLPIELVEQFYQNSPFFTLADGINIGDIYKPIKLIDNGSR